MRDILSRLASLSVCLLLWFAVAGPTYCLEETIMMGERGNVSDPDADILQVSFELNDESLTILYVIDGRFVDKYSYAISLHAYEENRTFGSIILGYYQEKQGVYYVDQLSGQVKPLKYSIQGSTLKITGLALSDLGGRYAFYASAQTAVERNKQVVQVDTEPREGARKIILPSPEPSESETSSTTPTEAANRATSQPTTATPYSSPTTTVLVTLAVVVLLSGLVIWRSSLKERTEKDKARRR
ncbi:hypothetical protein KEJ39_05880 [Candidatus Bathyarchaeota archaeon]|nr:hypothetical protein [Candidatus Bathyarchaeota archaeon]